MKSAGPTSLKKVFVRLLSGVLGTGLVFVLSPIILLLVGSFPEVGEHANVELGFSLLALAGASGCVVGLISNVHGLLEAPLTIDSSFLRLPAQPGPAPGERPEQRERVLPVVNPSLVLPTLISGLGGWVEVFSCAPRAEARPSAA